MIFFVYLNSKGGRCHVMKELTKNQKEFADNYIKSGNASQAYREAGYKTTNDRVIRANSSRLLAKANVKQYIEERMAEIASDKIMDAQEALELITRIARGKELETIVTGTPSGVYKTEVPANLKVKLAAAKEILKRHPENDEMMKVQYRKAVADADVAESKAKITKAQEEALIGGEDSIQDDGFIEAIKDSSKDIWKDDDNED